MFIHLVRFFRPTREFGHVAFVFPCTMRIAQALLLCGNEIQGRRYLRQAPVGGAVHTSSMSEEPTGPPVACVLALGRVCALAPGFPGGRCRAVVTTLGPGGSDPNNESPGLRCRGMPAQTAGWRGKASDRAASKRCPPAPTSHSHELQTCLSHRVLQKTIYCLLKSRFPEVLQTPA